MHRLAATLLCMTIFAATAQTGFAQTKPQSSNGCGGKSVQELFAALPREKQETAQKLFTDYSAAIQALVGKEQEARAALDAVLTDTAATAQAVEQKTRELIERQEHIVRERVAFRMRLAAETGIRLPFQMSGAGVSFHGSGCGGEGDGPGNRQDTETGRTTQGADLLPPQR